MGDIMREFDIDVLVIGAGAGGLTAAIAAADAGASVAIVEKFGRPGGNSSLSTGSITGAGTRMQREAGIADSPAQLVSDLRALSPENDCPDLVQRLAEVSAATVEWLIDELGARIGLITDYKHVGHSVPRLHGPQSRRGQDLVDDLVRAAEQREIPIAVGNPVVGLLRDEEGQPSGAIIETAEGRHEMRARKTILAVNGYAANRDLIARFIPEVGGIEYFGAQGSTGEAVLWGESVGAVLENMGAYQGYAAVSYPHGGLLSWTTVEMGAFLVDRDGLRFGDESVGYSAFAQHVAARPAPHFVIFDQRMFDIAARESEFVELADYGGFQSADSMAALAQALGIAPDALEATASRYTAAASGEAPDPFGRHEFALAPLVSPFYGCRVTPGIFHTQGGLGVDDHGRVRTASGLVPNLFAVGGAAAGVSGRAGPHGYASGNGLLAAVCLGRLAGNRAAYEAAREARQ
jgi:fumarate reductase flavoprotein subunit